MTDKVEEKFEDEEKKWVPLIGQFIFDFANIEDYLHQVIQYYLSSTQIRSDDISTSLPKRISLFKRILLSNVVKEPAKQKIFEETINQILELVEIRNLVAHNSLSLSLYEKDGNFHVSGFEISGRKKDKFLTYDDLKEKSVQLNSCRKKLSEFMLDFYLITHEESKRKALANMLVSKN